ncbi:amidase [Actinoallomurus sp. NPDC050550]|uniref:amidase n=1 Tax=Actinoallomurus sp. NPDC050550 TaxID=3154937 RepID=UPI0033EC3EEC
MGRFGGIVVRGLAMETRWLDATGQAELVASGQVTALELLEAAIERIEALDPAINAVVMRWFDMARETASGQLPDGVLRGVPFLLKDWVAACAGQPLCNGNQRLKELAPPSPADTTLVSRFRRAGLVIAGRTSTPEFANQATTQSRAWGITRNPWNLAYSPGGSSGGAAAAVAAGMIPVAHATDGSGSIRIPAACCGLVGLKPSQGRISAGPFGDESGSGVELCVSRTVRDTAAVLDAVHGPGVGDTVTAPAPRRPYPQELSGDSGPLRIGLLDHYPRGGAVHPDCAQAVRQTAHLLQALGHHVEPAFPTALADPTITDRLSIVASSHMAQMIARLSETLRREATPDDVEHHTWALARKGREAGAVEYAQALAALTRHRRAMHQWWADGHDLLLTPTTGEPPAPLDAFTPDPTDPLANRHLQAKYTAFTRAFNLVGQPAISLPLHWNDAGLPVGVQLVAAYGREDQLINIAAQLEKAKPFSSVKPCN